MEQRRRAAGRDESWRMDELKQLANALMERAKQTDLGLVTAESCTAGLMCHVLADAEGASQFFHGGFVTYTKDHKSCALGVPETLLREKGAVCVEVARAMAEGALKHSKAGIAAAITGVAGPEPDEDGNPVGRVCIAVARRGTSTRNLERNYPDVGRDAIRARAVADALKAMTEALASVSAAA
jgi:nicotinamide-nucleotide amidase